MHCIILLDPLIPWYSIEVGDVHDPPELGDVDVSSKAAVVLWHNDLIFVQVFIGFIQIEVEAL